MTDSADRGRPTMPEAFDASQIFPKKSGEKRPVLVVLTGPQVGQRIRLEQAATIGRDPEADLVLVDGAVDWNHARVEPRAGTWVVRDLTGERRTEVNGVRVSELALTDDDQIIVGGTVVRFEVHDPVEQVYDELVLERLNTDELTGLLARRRFDFELMCAVMAARHRDEPLAVIVLDVDGLKNVNDAHGHLAGASVITQVGAIVGREVGKPGLSCRLGGDEFGIMLPASDHADGLEVSERIRVCVAGSTFAHEGVPLRVRLSGGVAVFPEHGDSPLALLRAADEALYRAKRAGGDRVELR